MTGSEALRALARVRTQHGKGSVEYADAVSKFLDAVVDPGTGEVVGVRRGTCPACRIFSPLLDLALRFNVGCAECGDTGLACPYCANAGWVRHYPEGVDPEAGTDPRPGRLRACPACLTPGQDGLERNSLRRLQILSTWYQPALHLEGAA